MSKFSLVSPYKPTGDQPQAIQKLISGVKAGLKHQVLLGVTGSGKTFTIANVIEKIDRPTLVISHNKTLAAQLFQEYREFFPKNAVEYFVSYYDYYQPEAYIPQTDTYIEKDADINENIDKLRLSATTSLMTRSDVVVVASVSCIYNLGSPQEYLQATLELRAGMPLRREDLITRLIQLFYERSDYDFKRGTFRVRGDTVDVYPAYLDYGIRLELGNEVLRSIRPFNPISGDNDNIVKLLNGYMVEENEPISNRTIKQYNNLAIQQFNHFTLFPSKHYITADGRKTAAISQIRGDLKKRVEELKSQGKNLEAHRLEQKTNYDLELIGELGYCKGIENYSRYFDGREIGEPPYTLLDFFPKDYLLIVDESHMSLPQIQGMYRGDRSRKETLIDYGFRLPSARDNRPLRFEEFLQRVNRVIYTSATPAVWEINQATVAAKTVAKDAQLQIMHSGVVEQLIRPTGLLDPEIDIRGAKNQIPNLISEIKKRVVVHERTLVTTLTKRMAEDLSEYLIEQGIKVHFLHADVQTLERSDILEDLRRGNYDVVVGINLLREGLDLPEVSLVAILDADKEGFLRSEVSLIQTMGRAARHVHGTVILYADKITGSIRRAVDEVNRRRQVQEEYNKKHGITPVSVQKPIREKLIEVEQKPPSSQTYSPYLPYPPMKNKQKLIRLLEAEMKEAAQNLEFECAAYLRDKIEDLKSD